MLRQVRGEGLYVGVNLIWASGYYFEKQFLTGHVNEPTYQLAFVGVQKDNNVSLTPQRTPHDANSLLHYDVEQAVFSSRYFGHPILLCLKNHDYPGVSSIRDWPSWNLPVMQSAKGQGAVAGYAHVGHGMDTKSRELPNYDIPDFEGIGANECLVDVTHGSVDFIAGAEFPPVQELNVWYHLLNCGFAIPMVGEIDSPGFGGRVGMGRTYVKLDGQPQGDIGYRAWVTGIKVGRIYFGDGRSHIINFRTGSNEVGNGPLELSGPGKVTLSADVAAWLTETPIDADADSQSFSSSGWNSYTYWHLERARIGTSRNVPLEVILNGYVVNRHEILADGELRNVSFQVQISHSSWIALRILPSSDTAPIYASVGHKSIRASRRSAQWCLDCIDLLWNRYGTLIRESERRSAALAWDHARDVYRRIISESVSD